MEICQICAFNLLGQYQQTKMEPALGKTQAIQKEHPESSVPKLGIYICSDGKSNDPDSLKTRAISIKDN